VNDKTETKIAFVFVPNMTQSEANKLADALHDNFQKLTPILNFNFLFLSVPTQFNAVNEYVEYFDSIKNALESLCEVKKADRKT